MHPSHQRRTTDRRPHADRLTDWLLTYAPLSTIAVLTLLVLGAMRRVDWTWPVLVTTAAIDLGLNLVRRHRTKRVAR